jgi:hypothetical protein
MAGFGNAAVRVVPVSDGRSAQDGNVGPGAISEKSGLRVPGVLRLGLRVFPPGQPLIMGIVNRTPDSFYRPGITYHRGRRLGVTPDCADGHDDHRAELTGIAGAEFGQMTAIQGSPRGTGSVVPA